MIKLSKCSVGCLLLTMFCLFTYAQYQCNWNTFSSGGGIMVSTNYRSGVTLGQTAIGNLTSTNILAKIGFWYPLPTTGITEQKDDALTQTNQIITKLYNAYPNPFKAQTAIRYSLSNQSKVSLYIYDASGRIVNKLINQEVALGVHTISWDGRNERGQKVSTGIYFYQLQTLNYSATKKILLVE